MCVHARDDKACFFLGVCSPAHVKCTTSSAARLIINTNINYLCMCVVQCGGGGVCSPRALLLRDNSAASEGLSLLLLYTSIRTKCSLALSQDLISRPLPTARSSFLLFHLTLFGHVSPEHCVINSLARDSPSLQMSCSLSLSLSLSHTNSKLYAIARAKPRLNQLMTLLALGRRGFHRSLFDSFDDLWG